MRQGGVAGAGRSWSRAAPTFDVAADNSEEERGWRRHRGGHPFQDGFPLVGAQLQPVELVALRVGVRGDTLAERSPLLRTGIAQHAPRAEGRDVKP
jgi:hypothetical protein